MKYKKHITLKYKYVEGEQSELELEKAFDTVISGVYWDLKAIFEAKKDYCCLLDFTAEDYPEYLLSTLTLTYV